MKTAKKNRHCGNCDHCGSKFPGPDGAIFEHRVCGKKPAVGAPYGEGGSDCRCVCDWVDKKSKPRGCPGWEGR